MADNIKHNGNKGLDPQPDKGNDGKGHQDNGQGHGNGNGRPPSRPSKPGSSSPSVAPWINPLFKD